MATTRMTRVSRFAVGGALATTALIGSLLAAPLTAGAAPQVTAPAAATPQTSAQVLASLRQLAISNEKLTEQYNQAQIDVTTAQQAAVRAGLTVTLDNAKLATARKALAFSLAAQYKGTSFSRTAALLGSDSGASYLERMQSLSFLAMHQNEVALGAAQATKDAAEAQQNAAVAVKTAVAKRTAVSAQRATLVTKIAQQKQLLASLTAQERAAYQAVAKPTPAQLATVATTVAAPTVGTASGSASGAASIAVKAALSQLGKPYSWGAAGPDSYDCSGLTMWAYAHAGISLPHQSELQQQLGTPVAEGQLQPGDLVFFGSPAYHVGIYLGNGLMVHAPTTGDVVKITSLSYMSDYSGARRVG